MIQILYRRADTGQITTEEYARKHPRTTIKQHILILRK